MYTGPNWLRRTFEGGVVGVDDDLCQERGDLAIRELVAESLLEEVADHPLALRTEHVERGRGLQGEQADLGPVAVGDDQLVVAVQLSEAAGGVRDVTPLHVGVSGLAAPQQRVAAERGDHAH